MAVNRRDKVVYNQPKTFEERLKIARDCRRCMELKMPVLVDGMDDAVCKAYSAWPVRSYLVGKDGRIVYMDGRGPGGFRPELLERALAEMFREPEGGKGDAKTGDRGAR